MTYITSSMAKVLKAFDTILQAWLRGLYAFKGISGMVRSGDAG